MIDYASSVAMLIALAIYHELTGRSVWRTVGLFFGCILSLPLAEFLRGAIQVFLP